MLRLRLGWGGGGIGGWDRNQSGGAGVDGQRFGWGESLVRGLRVRRLVGVRFGEEGGVGVDGFGGDGLEDGQVGLDAGESLGVGLDVLCLDGVGEVGEEVALDAEGDGRGGIASHLVKEIGVGVVLEGVGARPGVQASVEVLVG